MNELQHTIIDRKRYEQFQRDRYLQALYQKVDEIYEYAQIIELRQAGDEITRIYSNETVEAIAFWEKRINEYKRLTYFDLFPDL